MNMSPANRKAVALVLIVLALGIAIGAMGVTAVTSRAFAARERGTVVNGMPHLMGRMTQALNLTADQQKQVSDILINMQKGYATIRQQMNPQFEQVRNQGHEQIRQILTADQRPKFEEFLRQLDEDHRKRIAAAPNVGSNSAPNPAASSAPGSTSAPGQ